MHTLAILKKIAACLLLLCFVLPLSKCESKTGEGAQEVTKVSYLYGTEMGQEALDDIRAGKGDGFMTLLALLNVFFLPLLLLALPERLRNWAHAVFGLPAGYFLYCWLFVFYSPQYGGVLALLCWSFLFASGLWALLQRWRARRLNRARA